MLGSYLSNASTRHKKSTLVLIDNLVLNSVDDALEIVKRIKTLGQVMEFIDSCNDVQLIIEASILLFHICLQVRKIDWPEQTKIFDQLLSLKNKGKGKNSLL